MSGMTMGSGGGHGAAMRGMAAGHGGGVLGAGLIPEWLGLVGTAIFVVIIASHVRHLAMATGQRRPWHACHVLIAVGMAFMYAPAAVDPFAIPAEFWRVVFAVAAIVAGLWAIAGVQRTTTLIWLLTAIDLGVMVYMWEPHVAGPLGWTLAAYLFVQSTLWAADAYRRLDGGSPIVSWAVMSQAPAGAAIAVPVTAAEPLIGDLDISVSMLAMSLGMAYMLVAMLLG
jgi:hypothetical protein